MLKDASKYLGFFLGPCAGSRQWTASIAEFKERVDAIYTSGASIGLCSYVYNTQAVPVTMYVAQLTPPPDRITRLEMSALQRVTHMATNALALSDYYNLPCAGGPTLRSLSVAMHATLLRTACITVHCWKEWCSQLEVAAKECLPCGRWARGFLFPDFWDTAPFACSLQSAYRGFPCNPKIHPGASSILQEVCCGPPPDDPRMFHFCLLYTSPSPRD